MLLLLLLFFSFFVTSLSVTSRFRTRPQIHLLLFLFPPQLRSKSASLRKGDWRTKKASGGEEEGGREGLLTAGGSRLWQLFLLHPFTSPLFSHTTTRTRGCSRRVNRPAGATSLMSDVDELIKQLFPKGEDVLNSTTVEREVVKELPASLAEWDTSDDDDDKNKINTGGGGGGDKNGLKKVRGVGSTTCMTANIVGGQSAGEGACGNYFDESDEGDCDGTVVATSSFTVPFPSFPSNIGGSCKGKCLVTNVGAKGLPHPSIAKLLLVSEGRYNTQLTKKRLFEYMGAFHVSNPHVGNGASDKFADDTNGGGCPFIVCKRCNYAIVRLQGAAWQDDGGRTNLYLTVRNYYPDWCKLASSYPVGQTKSGEKCKVLKEKAGCVAYCCQCSWLTVSSAQEIIETGLTDHTGFLTGEQSNFFATQLPLPQGEGRRPPLWICRGHVAQF